MHLIMVLICIFLVTVSGEDMFYPPKSLLCEVSVHMFLFDLKFA